MIISVLKPCYYTCNYPDINVDHVDYSNLSEVKQFTQATISCAHMNVCKYYNADAEEDI